MTEEYWANSQFSIARHYGQIQINGKHYIIVNKQGITIFELSNPNSQHYVGDDKKAIPPGEPADLVLIQWGPIYKALGREWKARRAFRKALKERNDNLWALYYSL